MAQTSVNLDRVAKPSPADLAHKQLEVEKVGVIVGFLAGLPIAVGPVSEHLTALGVSDFVTGAAMVATVVATTRLGLRLGNALASLIGGHR